MKELTMVISVVLAIMYLLVPFLILVIAIQCGSLVKLIKSLLNGMADMNQRLQSLAELQETLLREQDKANQILLAAHDIRIEEEEAAGEEKSE